jgi:F-type H+-transporting ATPase subunit gamma
MPNLKSIRQRINTVKSTQKITRAMKMVAAARLRRAQEAIIAARPYARSLEEVITEVAARAGRDAHPLLADRPKNRVLMVPVSSDRGLAGAFNSQLNRAVERYRYEHVEQLAELRIGMLGRKGRDYLKRRKFAIDFEMPAASSAPPAGLASELAARVIDEFLTDKVDAVILVYNEFKSAISQKVELLQLLPIVPRGLAAGHTVTDYEYEPDRRTVLDHLLPMYVKIEIQRALLESVASEFGARMSAMDNASNNAKDMISSLSLQYNRARQAYITKELLEIIGGAEALKG